jgi:hypothetical protein
VRKGIRRDLGRGKSALRAQRVECRVSRSMGLI